MEERAQPGFEGLLTVAALEEQVLPRFAPKNAHLYLIVASADQRFLYIWLCQANQSSTVQVGFDFCEFTGAHDAFINPDLIAVVDFKMERPVILKKCTGVAFEVGAVEA